MVDIVNAPTAPLRITVRPNSSIRREESFRVLAVLLPAGALLGLALVAIGAWLVLPFLGATLATMAWAFHQVGRHADDFERITLDGDRLAVDRHSIEADEHFEFNGLWVELIRHEIGIGGCDYLALRSHGRELPLGHDMTDAERASVGNMLFGELRRLRH